MSDQPEGLAAVTVPGSTPLERQPVSIDRAVEEGVMIARAALVMEVKNSIIIDAIRDAKQYNEITVRDTVRRQLHALAIENDASGQRVEQLAEDVVAPGGPPPTSEGYQADDHSALKRRAIIHDQVSDELERLRDDAEYVAGVVEDARSQAWAEVGDAIAVKLLRSGPKATDPFYDDDKAARVRALVNINLRSLERSVKKAHRHEHHDRHHDKS